MPASRSYQDLRILKHSELLHISSLTIVVFYTLAFEDGEQVISPSKMDPGDRYDAFAMYGSIRELRERQNYTASGKGALGTLRHRFARPQNGT